MKRQTRDYRFRDWMGPLFVFIPAMSIASIYGGYAEVLQLPTARIAQLAPVLMLILVVVSFVISAPRIAAAIWWSGLACIAYAPLLLMAGSTQLSLSRELTPTEVVSFRHEFPVPMLFASSGKERSLRVKRQDFNEAMKRYVRGIGALIEQGAGEKP